MKDAADPGCSAQSGDTPGPLGCNDHGDPSKKYRLLPGKKKFVGAGPRQLHVQNWVWASELLKPEFGMEGIRHLKSPLVTGSGLPSDEPSTISSAPQSLSWPPEIEEELNQLWESTQRSVKGNFSSEFAAVIAKDAQGQLVMRNKHQGQSTTDEHSVPEDVELVDPRLSLVATIHTHPLRKANLPGFSGGDIARMINDKRTMKILRFGTEEFAMVRTGRTSNATLVQRDIQNEQVKIRQELMKGGISEADASRQSARILAERYGIAYYEGSGGRLTKVAPLK